MPLIAAGNSVATGNIIGRILPAPFIIQPDFTVAYDEALLTSEPTSEREGDGQTVVYELNPDAVWSDGTDITADDFEFTWQLQRSSDPADGGCPALLSTTGFDQIGSVEGSEDGKTVTVTYDTPYPDWKSIFTPLPGTPARHR